MPPPPAPNRKRVERFFWNRHYFRDKSPLARARRLLTIFAVIASAGWAAALIALPSRAAHYPVSHGPVASAHAAWDQHCEACHVPHSASEITPASLLDVNRRWNEFRCETCHAGAVERPKDYAPHHVTAIWKPNDENIGCAACHRDHQGRDFSLVKLPDQDCTQCHRDLKEHDRAQPIYQNVVTSFPGGHPEFTGAKKDFKRSLRFSHAHHLMQGIPLTPEAARNKTKGALRLEDIPAPFRDRYQAPGQKPDDLVQLTCASCHHLDTGRFSEAALTQRPDDSKIWQATQNLLSGMPVDALLPPRSAGAYYLPVTYEASCQACHPIEAAVVPPGGAKIEIKVPHRLTPENADNQLRLAALSEFVKPNKPFANKSRANRGRLDALESDSETLKELDEQLKSLTDQIKLQLLAESPDGQYAMSCAKCHEMKSGRGDFAVKSPTTPLIWYPHAKFDHSAHRAMTCASCHAEKQVQVKDAAELKQKISIPETAAIPGIENCQQCHAPISRTTVNGVGQQVGGVRHGCVDCHRYHNGEAPLHGPGSVLRDPPSDGRLDSEQFLRGSAKR